MPYGTTIKSTIKGMGLLVRTSEFFENLGERAQDLDFQMADEARSFVCRVWRRFPDQITGSNSLAGSFPRGYLNSLCRDQPLPELPPSPEFEGGQCEGVLYEVDIRIQQTDSRTCVPRPSVMRTITLGGAITGLSSFISGTFSTTTNCGGFTEAQTGNRVWRLNNSQGEFVQFIQGVGIPEAGNDDPLFQVEIVAVRRVDGLIDNCGEPQRIFPQTNPTQEDLTDVVSIPSPDGVPLSFPISIDVGNITFPLNVNLGGVALNVNLAGIEINFGGRGLDGIPLPLPDGGIHPLPIPIDVQPDRSPCPRLPSPDSDSFTETGMDEAESMDIDVGDTLRFVFLDIANTHTNIRSDSGNGAPDLFPLGWFEFRANDRYFPRGKINFKRNVFAAPEGATGFAYTLVGGILGAITLVTEEE